MQANCPKCANKIVIDDARVPERAFSVKCPKCQTSVKFPGKAAASVPPPLPPPVPPVAAARAPEPESVAPVRREMSLADAPRTAAGRALVSVGDRGQAAAVTAPLTRLGYQVDDLDGPEEGSRLIEQGVYDLVVTSRAAAAGKESLYQRMSRLSPDSRRRVFLVLVGEDFKTGDGTQAWIAMADLVAHPRDLGAADGILAKTVEERTRLYQVYVDARKRFEISSAL